MRPAPRSLLALSLAANAFLLAFVAMERARTHVPAALAPAPPRHSASPAARPATAPARALGEDDPLPREAVDALRSAGMSRDTLIHLLLADITRRSDRKLAALQVRYAPAPVPDADYQSLAVERQRTEQRELSALLGDGEYARWRREQVLDELGLPVAGITEAEGDEIVRLRERRQARVDEIQAAIESGAVDPIDGSQLQEEAAAACADAIARLLGPERSAPPARRDDPREEWRRTYAALQPSDSQLAAVEAAEAVYLERLQQLAAKSDLDPIGYAGSVDALEAERQRALETVFGADAYRQFVRGQDSTFQTLQRYAGPWQLSAPDIDFVYQRVQALRSRVDALTSDAIIEEEQGRAVDWPAMKRLAEAERTAAEHELEAYLGGERFRRLHQNGVFHAGEVGR